MSILVTRPSPSGEELVSRLRTLGLVAWSFPLIEFTPGRELPLLPGLLARLGANDLAFVLSQHAVSFAHAHLQQAGLSFPTEPAWFAIGRTTALALHTVSGIDVRYPHDREISEVLLQLPELQDVQGKHALILRGNGGRELLAETLTERGANVEFCECYQRSAKFYDGAEEAMRWHTRGVSTLVVTSGEMLQQLFFTYSSLVSGELVTSLPPGGGKRTSGEPCPGTGWQEIQVADNADNDALLRALQ